MGRIKKYTESKADLQSALKDSGKEPNYYALADECMSALLKDQ
ncbi:MAG: hypothetical protein R2877_05025 [Bdellovibrionota bacterium]